MNPGTVFETTRLDEMHWNKELKVAVRHTWGCTKGTRFVCFVLAIRPIGEFVNIDEVMNRFGWERKKSNASDPSVSGASVAQKRGPSRRRRS